VQLWQRLQTQANGLIMIDTLLQILYILIAIAMVVLILLQRGAGAQAGSGFGAGASGTVFGARGSANFLTKSTKWLSVLFFAVALFMAWKAVKINKPVAVGAETSLMSDVPAVPSTETAPAPAPVAAPAVPASTPAPAEIQPVVPEKAETAPAATPAEKK
jgi:preprotein translocase subunit SecG